MKLLFSFFTLLLVLSSAISQIPQSFSYQAVVRGANDNIIANQNVGVRISIIPDGSYALPVYSETHNIITNQLGLFSINVGEGEPVIGDFGSVKWWQGTMFLQTEVDITGGNNYLVLGSTQLVSVPFSLYSKGLILTNNNGESYEVTVDENGNLETAKVFLHCGDDFTDQRDGETYTTVRVGSQCWMSTNLRYGQMINSSATPSDNGIPEMYCYTDNPLTCELGGGLYLWDELMQYSTDSINQGLCPNGWRIPTDYDLKVLEGIADSQYGVGDPAWNQTGWRGSDAGGNLKSTISLGWLSPNTGATDLYGMNILGSGYYDGTSFLGGTENAYFFSSSESGSNAAIRRLDYDRATIFRDLVPKSYATSVRCIHNKILDNNAPEQPTSPNPAEGSTEQSNSTTLSWNCIDPDGDPLNYDVSFGVNNPPPLVSSGQALNSYDPGQLQAGTTYFWKITAHDYSLETEGAIWSFTTTSNNPPQPPANPTPANSAIDQNPAGVILSWTCSDTENDPLTYDVYLGNSIPPDPQEFGSSETTFNTGQLDPGADYYWQIIAHDGINQTESPVWTFTTILNDPPNPPSNPLPLDGELMAWGNNIISWSCSDPENDPLSYDVYFGEFDPGNTQLIDSGITDTLYDVSAYAFPGNDYYWYVIAHDQYSSTEGETWGFFRDYPPVGIPETPAPIDVSVDISVNTDLSWTCTVYEGCYDYQINFGTTNPPPFFELVADCDQVTYSELGILNTGTTYYWQIIVTDIHGNGSAGEIWSFTTEN